MTSISDPPPPPPLHLSSCTELHFFFLLSLAFSHAIVPGREKELGNVIFGREENNQPALTRTAYSMMIMAMMHTKTELAHEWRLTIEYFSRFNSRVRWGASVRRWVSLYLCMHNVCCRHIRTWSPRRGGGGAPIDQSVLSIPKGSLSQRAAISFNRQLVIYQQSTLIWSGRNCYYERSSSSQLRTGNRCRNKEQRQSRSPFYFIRNGGKEKAKTPTIESFFLTYFACYPSVLCCVHAAEFGVENRHRRRTLLYAPETKVYNYTRIRHQSTFYLICSPDTKTRRFARQIKNSVRSNYVICHSWLEKSGEKIRAAKKRIEISRNYDVTKRGEEKRICFDIIDTSNSCL